MRYLHSDIDTLERVEILRDLRRGDFDVLVGINLLREGWTCRRCRWSRSSTPTRRASCARPASLIQTSGRAARNVNGRVIMYADTMTDSMRSAIDETERRRARAGGLQRGARHHAGQSIVKAIDDVLSSVYERDYSTVAEPRDDAASVPDAGRARRRHRRARAAR